MISTVSNLLFQIRFKVFHLTFRYTYAKMRSMSALRVLCPIDRSLCVPTWIRLSQRSVC